VDGAVCAAYGVSRGPAAAPVERHTVVIGSDGLVREVFGSEFRFSALAGQALAALHQP
jgi:peroxiredoxin Q/BCP